MQNYQDPSPRIMDFHARILPPHDAVQYVLPFGPSANHLYRGTGRNRTRTEAYDHWHHLATGLILQQRAKMTMKAIPPTRYCAGVLVSPLDVNGLDKADLDNRIKAMLDVLQFMRVTPNDSLCDSIVTQREAMMEPGWTQVAVWPFNVGKAT